MLGRELDRSKGAGKTHDAERDPVTFHALRHTHASQLIDAGVDIVKISKRLGHVNPTFTLRIYAHLFRRRDDISAEVINTALADINVS